MTPSIAVFGARRPASDGTAPAAPLVGGSALVGSGLAIELGSQFARTMILARLLGAHEFGLVVSINMLAALADMFSSIGLDRYIVYSREGGDPRALGVAHTLSLLRGLISAALIVILALPTASIIGAQPFVYSFAIVAIGPLLRGGAHLGVTQRQRFGSFGPSAAADAGAALLGLAAATIAALVAADHRAILWGLGAQAAGNLVLTHLLARQRYRLSFDRARIGGALKFGLPLLANGIALSAAYQLDRMVVGTWLGIAALGIYGLATILLQQPIAMLVRLATTVLQPRLSAAWHADPSGVFPDMVRRFGRDGAIVAGAGAAATACLGAPAMRIAFGASFAASDAFFVIMAAVVLVRVHRAAVNLLGLAIGRTFDLMIANIVGAAALPTMIVAFYVHAGPASAVFGVLFGEVAGFAVAHIRLRRYCGSAETAILNGMLRIAVVPVVLGVWILWAEPALWMRAMATLIGCGAVVSLSLAGSSRLPARFAAAP